MSAYIVGMLVRKRSHSIRRKLGIDLESATLPVYHTKILLASTCRIGIRRVNLYFACC